MRKIQILSILVSVFLIFAASVYAVPAFPGAEGAGKYATGGRGGTVYEVNTLDDYGPDPCTPIPGSLRYGLMQTGARIIVFRVSGTIELKRGISLIMAQANLTVAGQTAPGDGITLKNYPFNVASPNVIIRYIRVRPSEKKGTYPNDSSRDIDCMTISPSGNVIIDHCSFSWGLDETVSPSAATTSEPNLTVQWCILSNPLNKSVHTEGEHGKATLAYGAYDSKMSFHHNIYAHSMDRNPRVAGLVDHGSDPNGLKFEFCNNVVYNWGGDYPSFSRNASCITRVNFIGNYYKSGVNSSGSTYAYQAVDVYGQGYFHDNWMNGSTPDEPCDLVWFYNFTEGQKGIYLQDELEGPIPISSLPVEDALVSYAKVLADAGCTVPYRDSVDARVVNEIHTGTGRVINCTTPGNFYYQIGTAQGGTADTIQFAATYPGRETGQDNYDVVITGPPENPAVGQTRRITAYNETSKVATVSPNWTVIPDSNSQYGVIVDCTYNGGGWPVLNSTTPPTDTDHDGMPNDWETARGLNPNNPSDGNSVAASGYTNVEEYLNWLVDKKRELPADFDNDGDVDYGDLDLLTGDWLDNDCNTVPRRNLDIDCDVDFKDYSFLADVNEWLQEYWY